ncbi:MAG TPA: TonB-dependent receptor [Flavisolibacter sp.]|nr:TonB-dependent receptor [Flavisolibacter sp.]
MKKKKRLLSLGFNTMLALLFSISVYAQQTVRGTLRNSTGEPLTGATVTVKGTNQSVVTDASGQFSITAPVGATLVVSYVGFSNQEVTVTDNTPLSIQMQTSSQDLQQVVVIGYQTVRKRDLTGATSVVNTQNTQRLASRSLPEQLQGMAAGVAVRTGGAPGQEAVVNIRGLSTVFGNGNPLYVIDGMFSDPNTTVNPNDIESVQVLKDASAAAIYGSRAGNGVIIITTKRGKEGPLKVSGSARYSSSMVPKKYDMMSASEYVATNKQAYQNAGYALQGDVANYNGANNTNWADLIIGRGSLQDYNVTLSGGGRNSSILISGSYLRDKGTLLGHSFERGALRINSDASRGRFKITQNLMLSNSTRKSPQQGNFEVGNPWYDLFNNLPILPVRDPKYITAANPSGYSLGSNNARTFSRSPVAIADLWKVKSNFFKILGNVFLDAKIADFLSYRFNIAGETSFDETGTIRKTGIWYQNQSEKPSSVEDARGQYLSTLFEHTLNFNKNFNKHTLSAVAGLSDQTISDEGNVASRTNLAIYGGSYFTSINSAGGASGSAGASGKTYISSYFGRLNYNYGDRYLASFTFRSDKSSLFSRNNRRGFFPSGAVAWRIDREDFFKSSAISNLKLRGSYGVLGVAGFPAGNAGRYQYTGFLNQAPRAVFGSDQQSYLGAAQTRLVYEDLKWEEKKTANIGLDAGFLNNTLTATIDVFRSKTDDVLIQQPLAGFLGNIGDDPIVNLGVIENKGIEFELGYRPRAQGNFQWNVAANFSVIKNKILALGNLGIDPQTGKARNYIQSGNTRSQVGRSIGEYYVLKTAGIFQTQKEIDDHKAQAAYAKPGDIRYLNLQDGGSNDDINDRDREFAGSPWPKFTTGLQFNGSFKEFSLNVQLYGAFGQKIYNDVIRDLDAMGYSNYRRGLSYWTTSNPSTTTPRLGVSYATGQPGDPQVDRGIVSNARGNTDRWIESGSYLRIRNVELAYALPRGFLSRLHLTDSRIYISGQNLATFTKYKGLDPDVVGANANLEPGVDVGAYPSSRILTVGINVGF